MSAAPERFLFDSSLLSSAIHSPDATLEVEFHQGTTYRYFAVPRSVFFDLCTAASAGAYFNARIKDRYPFQRIA